MAPQDFQLERFLPYLLNQAAEASSLAFSQVYKDRYGMLRTEWRVLFHLGLYGTLTASEIAHRARMHKTKISRAVQRLSDRRFVSRTRDEGDRRIEHLSLTPKGRAAYDDLRATAQRCHAHLLEGFSHEEARVLQEALIRLTEMQPGDFT